MYQPAVAKPARPAVVTLAVVIMVFIALLSLLAAVVGLASMSESVEQFRRLAADEDLTADEVDGVASALQFGFICNAAVQVALAALLGGLAFGVARGSHGARVTTWAVCVLGVLCACCTGFGSLATFGTATVDTADPDQVLGDIVLRSLPDWAGTAWLGSSGLQVLGYIATAILLALPPANAYFRRARPAGWTPPSYPQNPPGYPQNPPNYPQPPSHPSHPAPPNYPQPPSHPSHPAPPES